MDKLNFLSIKEAFEKTYNEFESGEKSLHPALKTMLDQNPDLKSSIKDYVDRETNDDAYHEVVENFTEYAPQDVLIAIKRVSEKYFGWIKGMVTPGFFSDSKPAYINVCIGFDEKGEMQYESCFYGRFGISLWEDAYADVDARFGQSSISVTCRKKWRKDVEKFIKAIKTYLTTNSIMKGQILTYDKSELSFMNLKPSFNIILNEDEEQIVDNFILKPLGSPGKRAALFTGSYGTGKTETAMRVGVEARKKGVTYIYCKDTSLFSNLLTVAKTYQPACIFIEDLDSIGGGEDRTQEINALLNTLDGVETKNQDLTVIFTTNHEDRINSALRRPGRIDVVVQFNNCTPDTIHKIYESYFSELKGAKKLNYTALVGQTPEAQGAVISEICKRSVQLCCIANNGVITDSIVESAISSLQHQLTFMQKEVEKTESDKEKMLSLLMGEISNTVKQSIEEYYED